MVSAWPLASLAATVASNESAAKYPRIFTPAGAGQKFRSEVDVNLNELRDMVHRTAVEHGWWDWSAIKVCCEFPAATRDDLTVNEVGAKLALVHSEVSEALECVRENPSGIVAPSTHLIPNPDGTLGKPEGFASELADVLIRVLDICGALDIDIEAEVMAKHRYNETRPSRHGGKAL